MLQFLFAIAVTGTFWSDPVTPILGEWRGTGLFDGQLSQGRFAATWNLVLKPDGSFLWHMENHVMMDLLEDGTGKYSFASRHVTLKGRSTVKSDDGYRRSTFTKSIDWSLSWENGQLVMVAGNDMSVIFTRPGKAPILPPRKGVAPLQPSDPASVELAREVESFYASLNSYADEGSVRSNGEGYQPENVQFRTRFQRPSKFVFDASQMADGKAFARDVVWTDGRKSWLYMSDPGGSEERPLGNGLSVIGVGSGQETELIPGLLMPRTQGRHPLTSYKQISLRPNEVIAGKKCKVIELANNRKYAMTLWIEAASKLIVKAHFTFANEDVIYHPRPNAAIPARDFMPNLPKS